MIMYRYLGKHIFMGYLYIPVLFFVKYYLKFYKNNSKYNNV